MNFAIAVLLLTISKPVDASAKAAKEAQGEGSRSSGGGASSLEDFSYKPPANFEGVYHSCFKTITRNSATGVQTGTFNTCEDLVNLNITSTNPFGAYMASGVIQNPNIPMADWGHWQGQAQGNKLFMASFGGDVAAGDAILRNDAPDRKNCDLFAHGVLRCFTVHTEYCGADDVVDVCEGNDGKWLNTYTTWAVYAQDVDRCPPAPSGFCVDGLGAAIADEFDRRLEDEEEQDEEEEATCPLLQGK